MEELLSLLVSPEENETYTDYKSRMEAIHGSEGLIPKAIKIKYSNAIHGF